VECHVMNTIQKSNLHGSFLNEQFLPTCQDGGKLTVKQGEEESDVIHTTCNGETGFYNYTYRANNRNVARLVNDATVLKCTYPVIINPHAGTDWAMVGAGIGTFIVSLAIALPVAVKVVKRRERETME
ncbi:hypothetical protein PFISCL1PPCAC_7861, partial [Pristionchus fissidentatus]